MNPSLSYKTNYPNRASKEFFLSKTKKCPNAKYSNAHIKVAKGEEVGAVESVKAASEVGIQSLEIVENFFEI